jgi:para-nitrobenzyl esterase
MSGFAKNGIKRWLGIPYARAERFGAPQKIPFGGDEDGLQFAPQCPQLFGTKPRRFSITGSGYGEDCLALNI